MILITIWSIGLLVLNIKNACDKMTEHTGSPSTLNQINQMKQNYQLLRPDLVDLNVCCSRLSNTLDIMEGSPK